MIAVDEALAEFERLRREDVDFAGGKGANLGELTAAGFPVPAGFVIGAPAYAAFCDHSGLRSRIGVRLAQVDVEDTAILERVADEIRATIESEPIPDWLGAAIREAYLGLANVGEPVAVAVRSSATEAASFAGMNETLLNRVGASEVLDAVRRCWSSLFGARTIYYRSQKGLGQAEMDIAIVVQRQIEASRAGVMFTIDPATGSSDSLVIEGAFGLGESVVSGAVSPDRYVVNKTGLEIEAREIRHTGAGTALLAAPGGGIVGRTLTPGEIKRAVLSDEEIRRVATLGVRIEAHYGSAQDTEWAIDPDGKVWMLQSRPVTSTGSDGHSPKVSGSAKALARGFGAAPGVGVGPVRVVESREEAARLHDGEVLVTRMTTPDWVPLMRKAAAIVTDSGGMSCHAAIVSRELGIPCVVGAGDATAVLADGDSVTVDAGAGVVYEGIVALARAPDEVDLSEPDAPAQELRTKLLLNLSEPSQLERVKGLDVDGVGLLRAELMVVEALDGEHPRALLERGEGELFVERMADSLGQFAQAFTPRPITYRTIDFRSNEFRGLRGGERFEPQEANPMIGYRGALRYTREPDLLALELRALERVWAGGLTNIHLMLPFVRTPREVEFCRDQIEQVGLLARPSFELWVMAEVPSVLFHLARYADLGIAGISIGSNDLTQLLLGADRDSELVAEVFDERDPAVTEYIVELLSRAQGLGLKASICGQAPSVYPEYAKLLVACGIDAISVNVDAVGRARRLIAAAESGSYLDRDRPEGEAS